MFDYNLSVEYASFIILIAVLISFFKDYDVKTLNYKVIRTLYVIAFLSVLFTLISAEMTNGSITSGSLWLSYTVTMIRFLLVPCVVVFFIVYSVQITTFKKQDKPIVKPLFPIFIPYIGYVLFVLIATPKDWLFTITLEEGYIRGPFYYVPAVIIGIYLIIMFVLLLSNLYSHTKDIAPVLIATLGCTIIFICVQILVPSLIVTGIANTMAILIIHFHVQNISKSSDNLTGLLNRTCLMHKVNESIKKKKNFSLYVFSLRNFNMVNERYGVDIGDNVLKQVGHILMDSFNFRNVFRYGGDEFAILLTEEADVTIVVDKFKQSILLYSKEIFIDVVYARVDYPEFGFTYQDLISAIDFSIKTLKEDLHGKQYLYDISIVENRLHKYNMIDKLKRALEHDEFIVHYQPIFSEELGCYVQAEALVRMQGDDGKLIYPGDFIDIAEQTGLVVRLTYKVLDIVCRDLREIIDNCIGNDNFASISINFPYLQFFNPNMIDRVMEILNRYEIEPSMIKIEITERTLIDDSDYIKNLMGIMQHKGFVFELDDFGVDYSNLSVLLDLPLNIIKIDRSLLLSVFGTQENEQFFKHLVCAVKAVDRSVLIEGIEEEEQRDFCLRAGCDLFQGYFFSRPVPFEKFKELI
ncbi:MAG: hypothetical protein ATN34_03150 [Epulopiscium sp. Nele67-Bin002]|nr:MAG: hypothetical protein ATN34_03150 [Epulopiscium sp. Nele67-Bin002]